MAKELTFVSVLSWLLGFAFSHGQSQLNSIWLITSWTKSVSLVKTSEGKGF